MTSLAACHDARVKGRLDVAGEESCEQTAIGKFKSRTKTIGCPTCTNLGTVSSALEAFVDSTAGALFCQPGGTPIGTDDQGRVPADAPNGAVTKCALKVNKLAMSLAKKMIKSCHTKRAGGKLTSESAEDACETALRTKFVQQVSGLTGCDPCVNGTSIAGLVESGVDGNNGTMYCSPSSAFLSRTRGWLSSLF